MTLLTGGTRLLRRACRVSAIIWARARRAAYGWSVSDSGVRKSGFCNSDIFDPSGGANTNANAAQSIANQGLEKFSPTGLAAAG